MNDLKRAYKKILKDETRFAISAVPSVNTSRRNAGEAIEGPKDRRSFPTLFSEIFGKSIDGRKPKCLLGNLSP